jgi:hypothetical protein
MAGTPGRRFTSDDWTQVIVPALVRELGEERAALVVAAAHQRAGIGAPTGQLVRAVIGYRDYPTMRVLDKILATL